MASWQNSSGKENHKSIFENVSHDRCIICNQDRTETARTDFTIMFSEFHAGKNVLGGKSYGVFRVMDLQSATISADLTWSHGDFKFNHIFVDGSVRAVSHVATYSGSGLDPWNDTSTIDTMWDSMR